MRSCIAKSSFNSKRCCQRRTIQGTLPARREADIHIHTISTMPVQHAEHRSIPTINCTSPVRVQQHCRMWRHLVQCATSCPEHIIVHDCRRRKRLGQPGEPLLGRGRPDRGRRQHGSREAQHRGARNGELTPSSCPCRQAGASITNRALRRGDVARDVALPCRAGRGCRRCGFRLARVRQASAVSHWPVAHQPGRRRAEGAHGELQPRRQLHRLAGRDRHGLRRGAARASVGVQVAPRHDALARHALQVGGGRGAGGSA